MRRQRRKGGSRAAGKGCHFFHRGYGARNAEGGEFWRQKARVLSHSGWRGLWGRRERFRTGGNVFRRRVRDRHHSGGRCLWVQKERFSAGSVVLWQRRVRVLGHSGGRCLWGRKERFPPCLALAGKVERGFFQDLLMLVLQDLLLLGPRLPLLKGQPILQCARGLERFS